MVVFLYTMRRVDCRDCGMRVEEVPWGIGKHQLTKAYMPGGSSGESVGECLRRHSPTDSPEEPFNPALLGSQFDAPQEPRDAFVVDIDQPQAAIAETIAAHVKP